MKFKAKKGTLFLAITFGLTGLFLVFISYRIFSESSFNYEFFPSDLVLILVLILLFWILMSTKYELSDKYLFYQSGPIKGKIEIDKIREIIVGKSLWAGLKPALATKGLIIKYNKYDEIYISPESNELFVQKIKEINPGINIIEENK
ncbi:PH domain-containing protein [Gramella sp. GC03-9]|uniref:PH domain-containing protein n=1 Tax=Christiangramia oceanisediminis TaxID=2920386 RepID=A0A9X2RAA7_9FLAO|nr:PH domain-containing protein [Gramella oceanisediminis]MCP9201263.1 PH domain-containing protein [Gramella oceanisediminis]